MIFIAGTLVILANLSLVFLDNVALSCFLNIAAAAVLFKGVRHGRRK